MPTCFQNDYDEYLAVALNNIIIVVVLVPVEATTSTSSDCDISLLSFSSRLCNIPLHSNSRLIKVILLFLR